MKVYVVNEYCIDDYEYRWKDSNVYYHKSNALKKLQDVKEQDMMPIVDEEGYDISIDTETCFEAGRDGNYSKGSVFIEIVETSILDYHIAEE